VSGGRLTFERTLVTIVVSYRTYQ